MRLEPSNEQVELCFSVNHDSHLALSKEDRYRSYAMWLQGYQAQGKAVVALDYSLMATFYNLARSMV